MKFSVQALAVAALTSLTLVSADSFDDKARELMASLYVRGLAVAIKIPVSNDVIPKKKKNTVLTDLDLAYIPFDPLFAFQERDTIIRAYGKTASSCDSEDVTTDTAFMLASVSKPIAGAAVAKMIDQGLIQLDEDIGNSIPAGYGATNYRNPDHSATPVTWRHMVTHRSGLRDEIPEVANAKGVLIQPSYGPKGGYLGKGLGTCPMTDVRGFYRDYMEAGAPDTQIGRQDLSVYPGGTFDWYTNADGANAWSDNAPGADNEYSNFGLGYVAALAEHRTGKAFEDYCFDNLFAPLGMTRTKWFRESLPSGTRVAVPVLSDNCGAFTDVGHYCVIDYTSGQLYSTANDLAIWGKEMLSYGTTTLWSSTTANSVFGCQEKDQTGNLLADDVCEYSLAWEYLGNGKKDKEIAENKWMQAFKNYDWTKGVAHSGGEEGMLAQFIVFPASGAFGVIVLNSSPKEDDTPVEETNNPDNGDAAQTILGALFLEAQSPSSSCASSVYNYVVGKASSAVASASTFAHGLWA